MGSADIRANQGSKEPVHKGSSTSRELSEAADTLVCMFDRCPDAQLVTDLVAVQKTAPLLDPDAAAADLLEQAMAWERIGSWVESQRLATLRRFEAARTDADVEMCADMRAALAEKTSSQRAALLRMRADLDAEAGKFAAEEVALALNISPTSAHKQLVLARDLHTVHRDLGEALELGQVSPFVASMVAAATRKLPDSARRLLDAPVTADATELPAGKAIAAARNRVAEVDVDADAAAERARADRRAFFKPVEDGMAIVGAVLPADDAIRAWSRIDDLARTCRTAGDPHTLDQLRADLLAKALSEADLDTQPDADARHRRARRPVSVQVTIALTSLLGLDSRSGRLDGYGAITPSATRDIIAAGDTTLTRLLVDPVTGAVIVADPTKYRPDTATKHAVTCRDWHCRLPVCTARVRDLDHKHAYADDGRTTPDNLQGLCKRSHSAKSHPGWSVTGDTDTATTWRTPTGHEYTSLPPPSTGYGTGPPHELNDLPIRLDWLTTRQRLHIQLPAWSHRRDDKAA